MDGPAMGIREGQSPWLQAPPLPQPM